MKPRFALLALLVASLGLGAQEVFNGCPMEGDAQLPQVRALNRLKSRYDAPSTFNHAISLAALMQPGDDRTRWKARDAAVLTGYVADVKVGGVETCNCHARDQEGRDTHIELVLHPMNGAELPIIVEVTPRWRAIMAGRGVDWSTRALRDHFKGRWVVVSGWMLPDVEHMTQAENTNPGNPKNWRATIWELHPVTSIEIAGP